MGLAMTQCSLLMITARKADLEYRLLQITSALQRMTANETALYEETYTDLQSSDQDEESSVSSLFTSADTLEYEMRYRQLNNKEETLDAEKQQIELELEELNTLKESYESCLDQDLKDAVLDVE